MTSNGTGAISSTINVTPLIDVLLVLLIIFMVIVPVTPRGQQAVVPQPNHGGESDSTIVVSVLHGEGAQAAYRINSQDVDKKDLLARLTAIYANRAERILFVKGEDDTDFAQVAEVMDIGHSAGVDSIGLLSPRQ